MVIWMDFISNRGTPFQGTNSHHTCHFAVDIKQMAITIITGPSHFITNAYAFPLCTKFTHNEVIFYPIKWHPLDIKKRMNFSVNSVHMTLVVLHFIKF